MSHQDYKILGASGNIGFYQSCEVTQILLLTKDKPDLNFFTLVSYEEKPFEVRDHKFLAKKPLKISDTCSVGIQRYWLSIQEAETIFTRLTKDGQWEIDERKIMRLENFKLIPKQMIPPVEDKRINQVLKNNFHSGSYLLEFFDESKENFNSLLDLKKTKILNRIAEEIKELVPIDLSVARDRIGNVLFQFPISVLSISSQILSAREGQEITFRWHAKMKDLPDCIIETDSTLEKSYMGAAIQEYTKQKNQVIVTGNLDQISKIRVWRKEPNLLLSVSEGTFIKNMILRGGITSHEPRMFQLNGKTEKVEITSYQVTGKSEVDYVTHVHATIYQTEKIKLEKSLAFKQYFKGSSSEALTDIRILIDRNGANGVSLWDPFLRANDILQTLYFSKVSGAPLRAIGSVGKKTKIIQDGSNNEPKEVITEQQKIFDNPDHNNYGLNIEFRMQHTNYGWSFHDRFLIFPGNSMNTPKVYSLGTSINSLGQSHHILQEVAHPQRVIDAFEDLWEQLNNNDCIVWKYPRK